MKIPKKLEKRMAEQRHMACHEIVMDLPNKYRRKWDHDYARFTAEAGADWGFKQAFDELMPLIEEMAEVLEKHLDIRALKYGQPISQELMNEIYHGEDTKSVLANYNKMKAGE